MLLSLTPKGEKILRELSLHHKAELRMRGPALVAALKRVMQTGKGSNGLRPNASSTGRREMQRCQKAPAVVRASATIAATGGQVGDIRIAEPAQFRMVLMSFLAAGIGLLAGLIAFVLYKLIGLFTNIFFYHRFVADFISARHNQLGLWVIPIPVIGGIIVGFMAKYGIVED